MDFRNFTGKAAERIKAVFSKDNRFFYGTAEQQDNNYTEQQQAPAQGVYANAYQQNYYQQAPQAQAYQQPYQAQAYQQPAATYQNQGMQQTTAQAQAPYQTQWQSAPVQETAYQPVTQFQYNQTSSPQQSQLHQTNPDQTGRNRRATQHYSAAQPEDNIVQFPGVPAETATQQMDAYVINISNINGCRQAMTCLRKGQCTLVVMDQLIDKAEVRRYVDMLNGACFALGGTMTRLSLKVGFYILAPNGMMVYTDPVTASANAPARAQAPVQPQQGFPQAGAPAGQAMPQQPYQNVNYQPLPYQQQQQPYQQQTVPNPYAPPMTGSQAGYPHHEPYQNAQGYAQ